MLGRYITGEIKVVHMEIGYIARPLFPYTWILVSEPSRTKYNFFPCLIRPCLSSVTCRS